MSTNEDNSKRTSNTPTNNANDDLSFTAEYLIQRWEMGFSSILPSNPEGEFIDTKSLVTPTRQERFKSEFSNYSFCRFFYHVADYWTPETLRMWASKFRGVRVVGGKTYVRKNGKKSGPYRLFQLDIDSQGAYDLLETLLETRLLKLTYVIKSRKEYGYHVYWLEDWNDNQGDCTTIRADDCKTNYEFELFCGFQTTQIAGAHPKDPTGTFRYTEVGSTSLKEPELLVQNGLYDEIMLLLRDCLSDIENIRKRRKDQKKYNYIYHSGAENTDNDDSLAIYGSNRPTIKLTDLEINIAVEWASKFYGAEGEDHNQHYNFFSMAFIDTLIRRYVDEECIYKIMDQLFNRKPHTKYTKAYWHKLVSTGIYRLQTGQDLFGIPSLKKQIQNDPHFASDKIATEHIDELLSKLSIDDESILRVVAGIKGNSSDSNESQGNLVENSSQQKRQEQQQRKEKMDALFAELENSIPDKRFTDYIVKIIQKKVKRDIPLIKQILYTGLSAYQRDPINLGIVSPASEGKTYGVMEVLEGFPKEDIIKIGSMTPKVLIRERGIHVDMNNHPLRDRIFQLEKQIKIAKKKKKDDLVEKLTNDLRDLCDNSRDYIDLRNKILVFLERPDESILDILMSILSHDSFEIEHPYVFSIDNQGMAVKKILTIGWPAFIFCSAKDESEWDRWSEIESRCIITSPSMVKQKYGESITLSSQNKTLPKKLQQRLVRSDDQVELAKKCILYTKLTIQDANSFEIRPWSPFSWILSEIMQAKEGRDMRVGNRIFNLLNIIALTKLHLRRTIQLSDSDGVETSVIADVEDLKEVYSITQHITGMQLRKLREFIDVFCPAFHEKENEGPTKNEEGTFEKIMAVDIKEIAALS